MLTDVIGDEMVQLHMLETLRIIVNTANAEYLDDTTHWNILQFCCLNLAKSGKGLLLCVEYSLLSLYEFVMIVLRPYDA